MGRRGNIVSQNIDNSKTATGRHRDLNLTSTHHRAWVGFRIKGEKRRRLTLALNGYGRG